MASPSPARTQPEPTSIVIARPDHAGVKAASTSLADRARAVAVISNTDEHAHACELLKSVAACKAEVERKFAEPKKLAHDAHKSIVALEKELLVPLDTARMNLSRVIGAYEETERRRAVEAQRVLEAEARRQEEERQIQDAIELEESGDAAGAAAVLEEPVQVPVLVVAPQFTQVSGVSSRETWSCEVIDKARLVAYVAAHPEWLHLLDVNTTAANGLARSQKGALAIPGLRAIATRGMAVRS